jgi:AraC-like DNA-binding protein
MYESSRFYRNAAVLFASLLVATLAAGHMCFDQTFLVDRLLPGPKSVFPWFAATSSDAEDNGRSTIQLNDATQSLDYSFTISEGAPYNYASVDLSFIAADETSPRFADLSKYSHLRFNARCSPQNVLSFTVHTFDKRFTDLNNPETFRIPMTFFACDDQWTQVDIDLRHLEIPEWWLNAHKLPLSDRNYDLSQVSGLSFGISVQSPKDVMSAAKIVELELIGRDWKFAYIYGFCALALWLAYAFWFFKKHTQALIADLEERMQKDRPLIAYQQLSVEPHRDKEKSAVLRYMATEYANPDISLETAISTIGINRAKMNSILKDEIGLTFSAYLNKLRLTEAARLLSEKSEANVAEIAFSVGYNNVSYFNKLFKNEYGCSPKTFKSVYLQKNNDDAVDPESKQNTL